MKKILPVILIFTVIFGQSNFNKVGSVGVLFLNLPAGAAAQGMGNAYSSSIQGASAVFWNPALLGWSKSVQSFLSYSKWLLDLHHQTAAITFRLGRFGIGVSQSLLKSSPMLVTTTSQPRGTGEYFQYYDLAAGFSVARAFSDRFSLGGSFKIIHESAYEIHATGWGIDIGSFYWIGFNDWRITMVLRNFGPDMQFQGTFEDTRIKGNIKEVIRLPYGKFSLPIIFTMGIAGTIWKSNQQSLLVAIEATHPADYNQRLHFGGEYQVGEFFRIRGGYKLNYEQESWSVGCGFVNGKISMDIAYIPLKDFPGVLSYSFNYQI